MPLVTCPDCNKEVSDSAPSCPNCGRPMNNINNNETISESRETINPQAAQQAVTPTKSKWKKWHKIVSTVLIVMIIGIIALPDANNEKTGDQKAASQDNSPKGQFLTQLKEKLKELDAAKNFKEAEKLINAAFVGEFKDQYTKDDMLWLQQQKVMVLAFQLKTKEALAAIEEGLKQAPVDENFLFFKYAVYLDAKDYNKALQYAKDAQPHLKNNEIKQATKQAIQELTALNNGKLSPRELFNAFKSNELKANNQYRNKEIVLIGKISEISEGPLGAPQLEFNVGSYGLESVVCEFSRGDAGKLAELNKGQTVVLIGTVEGITLGMRVSVDDCSMSKYIKP